MYDPRIDQLETLVNELRDDQEKVQKSIKTTEETKTKLSTDLNEKIDAVEKNSRGLVDDFIKNKQQ